MHCFWHGMSTTAGPAKYLLLNMPASLVVCVTKRMAQRNAGYDLAQQVCERVRRAASGAMVLTRIMHHAGTQHMAGDAGWRTSLGLAGVPALILTLGALLLPETPNSLVERGHISQARTIPL